MSAGTVIGCARNERQFTSARLSTAPETRATDRVGMFTPPARPSTSTAKIRAVTIDLSFDPERTEPLRSRWDQDGAEYVRSDAEWVMRFAGRIVEHWPDVDRTSAQSIALEFSADGTLRALRPESAADCVVA